MTVSDNIPNRKQNHLDTCMSQPVEGSGSTFFEDVMFIHRSLPELNVSDIDPSTYFLKKKIDFPLFISCMTGGSEQGKHANIELAKAANTLNIPLGLGSARVLFSHPERIHDFQLRPFAPDIPILANLGGVQLLQFAPKQLEEMIKPLEVDALVIHLNAGQELFQERGDRNFKGIQPSIARVIEQLPYPVIVKETGFGISPREVRSLIEMGASYVDVAGAGGTNWISVETNSKSNEDFSGTAFMDWGTPTAVLLEATKVFKGKILSSGGLRSGMDLAKSIALGAVAGGMALPFIQAAIDGGAEESIVLGETIKRVFIATMLLTGSRTLEELRTQPLIKSIEFEHFAQRLKESDKIP